MPLAVLVIAAAGVAAVVRAPEAARVWVGATAAVGGMCVVVCTAVITWIVQRDAEHLAAMRSQVEQLREQTAFAHTDTAQLANVTLPAVAQHLHDGASVDAALAEIRPPADPQLQRVLHLFAATLASGEQRAAAATAHCTAAEERLAQYRAGAEELGKDLMPQVVERLRQGVSAETVLMDIRKPADPQLRRLQEDSVALVAVSERRSMAAMAASAKALSRVQAAATTILADLREMQERYGRDNEEVFGDLLGLDHSTSQLGLLADRLALLVGGRASRAWPKPIVMESILRGAVGRIAAYRRVRLHSTSTASIAGFAAEGVMHLLAELIDNATSFSPPIDEVHVYAEERISGIVVTVEGGLQMSDGALRRAQEAVSGKNTDLASLRGTRLGLPVVGLLARKFDVTVTYRPSSRGGTGVVVLIPRQLLAQHRGTAPAGAGAAAPAPLPRPASVSAPADTEARADGAADTKAAPERAPEPVAAEGPGAAAEEAAAEVPEAAVNEAAAAAPEPTPPPVGELPTRPRGATLAAVSRGQAAGTISTAPPPSPSPGDFGGRFRAFREASLGRSAGDGPADDGDGAADPDSAAQPPTP